VALADGRTFRTFNVVDDFTREALAIEVGRSIPGERVVRVLERISKARGLPRAIVLDHGPEFTRRVLDQWAYRCQVELRFIQPGKPVQNATSSAGASEARYRGVGAGARSTARRSGAAGRRTRC
jgi:putative transposase